MRAFVVLGCFFHTKQTVVCVCVCVSQEIGLGHTKQTVVCVCVCVSQEIGLGKCLRNDLGHKTATQSNSNDV